MSARHIAHPFALGPRLAQRGARARREGLAETTDADRHLRDKIVTVLMTAPGERVMNPRFGAGLDRSVFDNLSPLARAAVEYRIRESIDRDLGPEMMLEEVEVTIDPVNGAILIAIDYRRRADRVPQRLELVL